MALIKCPDCNSLISDSADKCVHCGRPMKESKEKILAEIQTLQREYDALNESYEELLVYYRNSDEETPDGWWVDILDREKEIELQIKSLKEKL